jgi:chaperonin GroEL
MPKSPKNILFGTAARGKLLRGVLQAANAAAVTLGPAGRTVLLERIAGTLATKDGATVVRELTLSDPGESTGASFLRYTCAEMSDSVGDGTTTTAILLGSLLKECHKYLATGSFPGDLVRGIRDASQQTLQVLQEMSLPVATEDLVHVALIASNGDVEIANLLAKAVMAVGSKGSISVEDGYGVETELLLRDGMSLDVLPQKQVKAVEHLVQPFVILFDCNLFTFEDIQDTLEVASQWPHPVAIFAHAVESTALATWNANRTGNSNWAGALFKVPGWGEHRKAFLDDLAALSGATVIDPQAGMSLQKIDPAWFGSVQTLNVVKKSTVLLGYEDTALEDRVQKRIKTLEHELEHSDSAYIKDRLRERIAKLSGGLAILRVGGITEVALKERRARIEDALCSVRVALESGIVPGAGAAYSFAAQWLEAQEGPSGDVGLGYRAFVHALRAPFRILLRNASQDAGSATRQVLKKQEESDFDPWVGWDLEQKVARSLHQNPLIADATKVAIEAIRYAVSTVTTMITTEVLITHV